MTEINKAKTARSPEKLISLTKRNDIELRDDETEEYSARLSSRKGGHDDKLDGALDSRKCVISSIGGLMTAEPHYTDKDGSRYHKNCINYHAATGYLKPVLLIRDSIIDSALQIVYKIGQNKMLMRQIA